MKTRILTVLLFATFFYSNAQDTTADVVDEVRKNELKVNMTNLIGFKWADFAYERVINEESTFGASVLFALDNDDDSGLDEIRKFSLTPYYRHFFSKKYAQGFFVEGFGMIHSGEDEFFVDDINGGRFTEQNYIDFAIGVSAGAKFVTKRGFVAEIYLGIGRDLLGKSEIEVVSRGGIALGYRF